MNKKLCLVIPSLNPGGMERVMSELAHYFCKIPDLDVHLVLYGIKPELFYSIPTNIILHKPPFRFNNKLRLWYTLKTLLYLRKEIKKIHPDSILSFGEYWNSFVLIALLGLRYKIFVSDRCQPNKSLGKLHNFLRKKLYPITEGIIVQTKIAKEVYKKFLPHCKLHVIGNPVKQIPANSGVKKENIVLSVGRLINTKHHEDLIKLFLKIDAPDWKLVIVGGDAQKQKNMEKLKKLIHELNAENRIILTGSRSDVEHFYLKSKIFAFTSSSEGFPNVIGEALSAGLPVIAFDCIAGPAEMIQNDLNGCLVPVLDFSAFEVELLELMGDESLIDKMGAEARKSIQKFNIDRIGQNYLNVILSKT